MAPIVCAVSRQAQVSHFLPNLTRGPHQSLLFVFSVSKMSELMQRKYRAFPPRHSRACHRRFTSARYLRSSVASSCRCLTSSRKACFFCSSSCCRIICYQPIDSFVDLLHLIFKIANMPVPRSFGHCLALLLAPYRSARHALWFGDIFLRPALPDTGDRFVPIRPPERVIRVAFGLPVARNRPEFTT
jgi:hypothetical protein